jgi:hypothetical protein
MFFMVRWIMDNVVQRTGETVVGERKTDWTFGIAFLVSRALVFFGVLAALWINPYYTQRLNIWEKWDSAYYASIARQGYQPPPANDLAYFPYYPVLVGALSETSTVYIVALLVSNVAFLMGLFFFYQLVRDDFSPLIARKSVWFLALFPTSLFFSVIYPEGLYFLMMVLVFWGARRRKWLIACLAAWIASGTRVQGILLWGAVGVEWLAAHEIQIQQIFGRLSQILRAAWREKRTVMMILILPPLGFLSFVLYQYLTYGSPTMYFSVQSQWRAAANIIDAFAEGLEEGFSGVAFGGNMPYYALLEVVGFCVAFVATLWIWRVRQSYALYSALYIIIPMWRGTNGNLRYMAMTFPLFILLALVLKQRWQIQLYNIIASVLLVIAMFLFIQAVWIG